MIFKQCISTLVLGCLLACTPISPSDQNSNQYHIELVTLNLAIGFAFSGRPDTIAPAYSISTALLFAVDNKQIVTLDQLDKVLLIEINKLELNELTKANFMDLVDLIKIHLSSKFTKNYNNFVLVVDVLKLVQHSAGQRLKIIK